MASLGLVSPGATTGGGGVALFFFQKTDDLFSHRIGRVMTFFSRRLLITPGDTLQG